MTASTTYDVMAVAPCPAFIWIGQAFNSCDKCGKPYWEHSHEYFYGTRDAGAPLSNYLRRGRRVIITRAEAEQVRSKWG